MQNFDKLKLLRLCGSQMASLFERHHLLCVIFSTITYLCLAMNNSLYNVVFLKAIPVQFASSIAALLFVLPIFLKVQTGLSNR